MLSSMRGRERFRGDVEPIEDVAGHIPGAVNRPYTDNMTADGRFKPPRIAREFAALLGDRAVGGRSHVRLRRHGLPQPARDGTCGTAARALSRIAERVVGGPRPMRAATADADTRHRSRVAAARGTAGRGIDASAA
jgi:hypothetical protein